MNYIINHLIQCGYFSLEILNNRRQEFNYDDTDFGNMSPLIVQIKLNSLKFEMSSSEMETFVHYFPLLIGDLVPEKDQIWLFLINFIEIIDMLLSKFNDRILLILQNHIKYQNDKYIELFNDTLKPKHHFLIRYCNEIKKSGPLRFLWCIGLNLSIGSLKPILKILHQEFKSLFH